MLGGDALHVTGVQGDAEHAHLHHADTGNRDAAQVLAELAVDQLALGRALEGAHAVAQGLDPAGQLRGLYQCRVIAQVEALLFQLDLGVLDARQAGQAVLDQPGTGGAGHAADQEARRLVAVGEAFGELFAQSGLVKQAELRLQVGGGLRGPGAVGGALAVETAHVAVGNQAGDGGAAGTAHRLRHAVDGNRQGLAGREGLAAVKTALTRSHAGLNPGRPGPGLPRG